MKRILIVMPSLVGGGAEKSLLTLLRVLGAQYGGGRDFHVDLLVFLHEGLFMAQVPGWVNLLPPVQAYTDFMASMQIDGTLRSVLHFLRRGQLRCAWARLLYRFHKLHTRAISPTLGAYQWKCIHHLFPRMKTRYAAAVAYLEGYATFFVAKKVSAAKKITYYHSNYHTPMAYHSANPAYYPHFHAIASISDVCCDALREAFPALADRVVKIENIVPRAAIAELAREPVASASDILTIARLSPEKGVDLAIRAAGILKRRGVCFTWGVVGTGGLQAALQQLIEEEGLTDCFFLLGEQANPYPALRACKIYVQPSRWEGKSIAIEEAKALQKPIICTRFGTVLEQIDDGRTGLVCKIAPASIAEAVQKLLEAPALRAQFIQNLKGLPGNETEAEKFLRMVGIY